MRLIFVTEARFIKDKNGSIFNSSFNNALWCRYLNVFSEIYVVARVLSDEHYTGDINCISSIDKVNFIALPHFVGLKQYLYSRKKVKKEIEKVVKRFKDDRFICRIPGTIGRLVINELNKTKIKYAVEVVGDPWDVFAPGANTHPLRPLIRLKSTYDLRKAVYNSDAALYVTQSTLQRRYPVKKTKFSTYASNVNIQIDQLASIPKTIRKTNDFNLISVGTLDQLYKFPQVVLKAIKKLDEEGITCKLTWLGGGIYLEQMKSLAQKLNISHLATFKGNVNSIIVKYELKKSELFVLASRQEGLPRAMIEAMAAGLPCVGSNVGGIPELLEKKVIVPKGNVNKLSKKIKEVLTNKDFYNQQAQRNILEAAKYTEEVLSERRNQFYNYIVDNL